MYLLLMLLWIILNGRCTLEVVAIGFAVVSAVRWFMYHHLEYDARLRPLSVDNLLRVGQYLVVLFVEIIKSGLAVLKFVVDRRINIEPQIVIFRVGLKSEFLKTVLANSITLTPGTITLNVEGDRFFVHALDYTLAQGLPTCRFVEILTRIEEGLEVREDG